MFQSLRTGSPFYILYKSEPKLSVGEVESVGSPVPQYGTTYQNGMITPPKNFVDVKVRIGGELVNLQMLPAELSIADFGTSGMVVSESREDILNEIIGFQGIAERELQDVPKNEHIVSECKAMRAMLDPQIAKEVEQSKKIEMLESRLGNIESMLSKALGRSSKTKEE